jgi:hypothetical protein
MRSLKLLLKSFFLRRFVSLFALFRGATPWFVVFSRAREKMHNFRILRERAAGRT